ncbi:hypothetical protein SDC9_83838 [bioreactor metagenome]|uniref:Uncharacterized protein n=1 Tax=bioreactor metagenome TaxID=1076179 RepID=A0A644ZBH5_9ZZZZ
MASPPAARISATTASAAVTEPPLPSTAPPRSFTTTLAPRAASASACCLPRPPPAPVTIATLPSKRIAIECFLLIHDETARCHQLAAHAHALVHVSTPIATAARQWSRVGNRLRAEGNGHSRLGLSLYSLNNCVDNCEHLRYLACKSLIYNE